MVYRSRGRVKLEDEMARVVLREFEKKRKVAGEIREAKQRDR